MGCFSRNYLQAALAGWMLGIPIPGISWHSQGQGWKKAKETMTLSIIKDWTLLSLAPKAAPGWHQWEQLKNQPHGTSGELEWPEANIYTDFLIWKKVTNFCNEMWSCLKFTVCHSPLWIQEQSFFQRKFLWWHTKKKTGYFLVKMAIKWACS